MTVFFFSSRRRHTRWNCDWSSDVCSSDLGRDLSLDEALGSAEILQAQRKRLGMVQARNGCVHGVENLGTLMRRHARQPLIIEDAALYEVHDVEGGAQDRTVFTEGEHLGNRDVAVPKRIQNAIFALYRMGLRQQRS